MQAGLGAAAVLLGTQVLQTLTLCQRSLDKDEPGKLGKAIKAMVDARASDMGQAVRDADESSFLGCLRTEIAKSKTGFLDQQPDTFNAWLKERCKCLRLDVIEVAE